MQPVNDMDTKTILIVDDDAAAREALSRVVNDAGYNFLTASDGSQAVSIVRQEKVDLILLDLIFPPDVANGGGVGWDGFLIIDWLRRIEQAIDIPVFVMTMGDPEQYRNRAFAKGAAAFFQKPINTDQLLETLRKTIGDVEPEEGDTVHVKLSGGSAIRVL